MPKKQQYTCQGDAWKQSVEKYGITAEQLVDQFDIKLSQAEAMIAGNFALLPDPADVKRLSNWYDMDRADAKTLNAEFDANYDAHHEWPSGIDRIGIKKDMDLDKIRGQRYREQIKATAPSKPAQDKPVDVPPAAVVDPMPEKPDVPAPPAQAASANVKGVPSEKDKAKHELTLFKTMSLHKKFNFLIAKSERSDEDLAQALNVTPETFRRWRMVAFKDGSHSAPAPVIIDRLIEVLSVEEAYANEMREKKATTGVDFKRHALLHAKVNAAHLEDDDATPPVKSLAVPVVGADVPEPEKERDGHWGEKKPPVTSEFAKPITSSGVAQFLSKRYMTPTAEFLSTIIGLQTAKAKNHSKAGLQRAQAVLLGAPLRDGEIDELKKSLAADANEIALMRGPGVVQLLNRRKLPSDAASLANWLGDNNGHALEESRVTEILQGAPLSETEISIFNSKLTGKQKLWGSELRMLQSQPARVVQAAAATYVEAIGPKEAREIG